MHKLEELLECDRFYEGLLGLQRGRDHDAEGVGVHSDLGVFYHLGELGARDEDKRFVCEFGVGEVQFVQLVFYLLGFRVLPFLSKWVGCDCVALVLKDPGRLVLRGFED